MGKPRFSTVSVAFGGSFGWGFGRWLRKSHLWLVVSEEIQILTRDFREHLEKFNEVLSVSSAEDCIQAFGFNEKGFQASQNPLRGCYKGFGNQISDTARKRGLWTAFHVRSGELELCRDISHSIMSSYLRHLSCRQPALWEWGSFSLKVIANDISAWQGGWVLLVVLLDLHHAGITTDFVVCIYVFLITF